jgi:hypothetical protein
MPEITVASTTDDQANINAAAGVLEEPKTETPEGEEPEEKSEAQPEKRDDGDWQTKRIKKLSAEKNEQKKELESLKQRLLAVEQGGKPQPVEEKPANQEVKTAPKPTVDQFSTYEDYTEALADWKVDEKLRKIEAEKVAKSAQDAAQKAQSTAIDKWNESIEEAKERYDDFEDVVGKSSLIPNEVAVAITRMKNGTDVAYYLGKHPEVCKKLMKMGNEGDLLTALTEIGGIARDLTPTEEGEEEGEVVPKVTTKAKTPPRPVAGSSTRSSVPIDELDYAAYRKIRDKQEKERYRR